MAIKLITTEDYGWNELPVSLYRPYSRGIEHPAGVKVASALAKQLEDLKPDKNETLVHTLAVGSTERYGPNRNGDGFSRAENRKAHPRFVTNGKVYKHHCFPPDTPVTMADGSVCPIHRVSVGSVVRAHDGEPAEVVRVFSRDYVGPIVRLTARGTSEVLEATPEHPVLLYRREQIHCRHGYSRLSMTLDRHACRCKEIRTPVGDPQWVPVKDVRPGDYLLTPVTPVGEESAVALARCIGWVASEGNVSRNGVQFSFSKENTADIEACKAAFYEIGVVLFSYEATDPACVLLAASSRKLRDFLSLYVQGTYSNKRLTDAFHAWDAASRLAFLGAYIDGDGCVSTKGKNKGCLRIRSASPHLMQQLSEIIHSLGVPSTSNIDNKAHNFSIGDSKTYVSRDSGCVAVAASMVGTLCSLSRKRRNLRQTERVGRFDLFNGSMLRCVTTVETRPYDGPVYNLETAVKHSYVACDVAVHNCNKDPSKASGNIKLSAYNEEMDRIELVIGLDNDKCRDEIQKLAEGKDVPGSMGCRVAFDVCLSPDTYVLTPDGPRQMRDLTVGDLVISHVGAARAITHVYVRSHERSSKVIRPWGAVDALHATDNHPIYVLPAGEATANQRQYRRKQLGGSDRVVGVVGYSAPAFVPASDVAEDDFLLYPVVRGSKQPTIDPWIAGLALGDGSVFGTRRGRKRDGEWRAYGIQFSLGLDKYEIVEHLLRRAADLGYSAKVYPEPGKAAVSVHVRSRHLAEEFSRLFGRSHDKHLSGEVLQWHPSALRSLIGGWLDADGSQDANKGSVRGVTVLPAVARGIWQAAVSAGIPCAAHWEDATSQWAVSGRVCMLHFQAAHTPVLSEHSVRVQAVSRRAKHLCFYIEHEGVEYLAMPVHSIETSTIEQTLNFGVEDDESYVASFAAVHNCSICGHHAPSPKEYCDHAKYAMTRIMDDGRQVYVDNPDPHYFDWSLVGRPADRIAFGTMLKTAAFDETFVFSTELAKLAGLYLPDSLDDQRLQAKIAALHKLSEMEKEVEGKLTPIDSTLCQAMDGGQPLADGECRKLRGCGMGRAMNALHNAKVLLPVSDFLRLISPEDQDLSEVADDVQGELPGIFGRMLGDQEPLENEIFDGQGELPAGLQGLIDRLSDDFGVGDLPLGRRVTITIIKRKPDPVRRVKKASNDPLVQGLARLYAQYKLAAAVHPANQADAALLRAAVLQHYYQP